MRREVLHSDAGAGLAPPRGARGAGNDGGIAAAEAGRGKPRPYERRKARAVGVLAAARREP